ncbi:MAG: coproporphyrinogen oxidase [Bacteroidetes bacterium]|jgi:coproporphyrinogen III oxidase|nr:coproporphyrinogen oxidase [Bacteroidota bacterium]
MPQDHIRPSKPEVSEFALGARTYFERLQGEICAALEHADHVAKFSVDRWDREGGGGGVSRVIQDGALFEKGGVNISEVTGDLPERLAESMNVATTQFYATGISLVLHPRSPMVPTVHMNYRYFEQQDGNGWFGGGSDLTPYYPVLEDIVHFHRVLKRACDAHDSAYYPKFKRWCDEYFFVRHRQERRGVGGIFFDYLKGDRARNFAFVQSAGNVFLESYLPIVERRRDLPWGERERRWQLLRRGRYVEFNLVYDRGTLFGLETGARAESVLMSLPPEARWEYAMRPEPGSREAELVALLMQPRDWVMEYEGK